LAYDASLDSVEALIENIEKIVYVWERLRGEISASFEETVVLIDF